MTGSSKALYIDKIICSNKMYHLSRKVLLEVISMSNDRVEWVCSRYNLQGSAQTEEEAVSEFFIAAGDKIELLRSRASTNLFWDVCYIEKRKAG